VLIEANPQRFQELNVETSWPTGQYLCLWGSFVPVYLVSIDHWCPYWSKREAPHLPHDFDFLSIDIDGMDYWLLRDLLGSMQVLLVDIDIGQRLYVSNSIPQCPLTLCMSSPATTTFGMGLLFLPWWSLRMQQTIHL
jgi:hypothetical protein